MKNVTPPKGMRDLLPKEVELRNYVSKVILGVYSKYGFSQIDTPSTEDIKLLCGGDGGENEKMIFKILKRGEKLDILNVKEENNLADLGLRYDLTVPLCRYYATNKAKLPQTFKVIQIGSVWRAEKPQKGRFRQFTQCDIDIIGQSNNIAEIELISATSEALLELGFLDFTVRINDRRILEEFVKYCGFEVSSTSKVLIVLDKLDKIQLSGVKSELTSLNFEEECINKFIYIISKFTSQEFRIQNLALEIPNIDNDVIKNLLFIIDTIEKRNFKYSIKFDLSLVRGMGYYTGPIFEIEVKNYGSSIAGGGRYDKMIGKILQSNDTIPACGFSIGFERVISILESQNYSVPNSKKKIVILFSETEIMLNKLFDEADQLRLKNNIVLLEIKGKNLSKQLDNLVEQGFEEYAIFNPNESIVVKNLKLNKKQSV